MKKLYTSLFAVAIAFGGISQSRTILIDGFTSNTCGPCSSFNAQYNATLSANNANVAGSNVAVLKYQMDWPTPGNDPSWNNDADARRNAYGVTGIPDWYIDGQSTNGSQADIDAALQVAPTVEIEAAYTLTGTTIDVDIEVTPLADLGNGYKIHVGIANRYYQYTGGTNGETEFHHVMRKLLPQPGGGFVSNIQTGVVQTFNYSYTYNVGTPTSGSFDFWDNDFEVVVWVQKPVTMDVANAAIVTEGNLAIEEGDEDDFALVAFPNPVQDNLNLKFDGNGQDDAIIEIYNMNGQKVMDKVVTRPYGRQNMDIQTTDLEAGLYSVRITMGDKVATQRLSVVR